MNNLLSYCGLIDAKIRASDKDLPVRESNLRAYCPNINTVTWTVKMKGDTSARTS